MADKPAGLFFWRNLAVLGVCLAFTPLWLAVDPLFWMARDYEQYPLPILGTIVGLLFVGVVYCAAAALRRMPPGIAFSFAVPAIGTVGVAFFAAIEEQSDGCVRDFAALFVSGMWWCVLACVVALPVAFPQSWIMAKAVSIGKPPIDNASKCLWTIFSRRLSSARP